MNDSITQRCKRNQTTILKAIAAVGQARIAELIGVSESTVSRYKDADVEKLAAVLAAAGLKVVLESANTVDADEWQATQVLLMKHLERQRADSGWGVLS